LVIDKTAPYYNTGGLDSKRFFAIVPQFFSPIAQDSPPMDFSNLKAGSQHKSPATRGIGQPEKSTTFEKGQDRSKSQSRRRSEGRFSLTFGDHRGIIWFVLMEEW
jgi:hypothetical protein